MKANLTAEGAIDGHKELLTSLTLYADSAYLGIMYLSEVRFSERPEAQKSHYSGGYTAHPTGVLCEVRCNVPSRESRQRTKKVLLSSLSRTQHSSLAVRAAELLKLPLPSNQARFFKKSPH